jgi:hypothetical protein
MLVLVPVKIKKGLNKWNHGTLSKIWDCWVVGRETGGIEGGMALRCIIIVNLSHDRAS